MKMQRIVPLLYALSALAILSLRAMAQEPTGTGSSSATVSASQGTMPEQPVPTYVRPTEKTKLTITYSMRSVLTLLQELCSLRALTRQKQPRRSRSGGKALVRSASVLGPTSASPR